MSGRRHRHRGWRSSNRSSSTSLTVVVASGSAGASPLQFSWARLALWLTGAWCSAPTPAWCCRLGSVAEVAWQQRRARLSRLKQCCASGAMLSHPTIGQPRFMSYAPPACSAALSLLTDSPAFGVSAPLHSGSSIDGTASTRTPAAPPPRLPRCRCRLRSLCPPMIHRRVPRGPSCPRSCPRLLVGTEPPARPIFA